MGMVIKKINKYKFRNTTIHSNSLHLRCYSNTTYIFELNIRDKYSIRKIELLNNTFTRTI